VTVDEIAKLIEALAKIISAVIWPAVLLCVIFGFRKSIEEFIPTLSAITLKLPGFEASASRQKKDAIAALTAAEFSQPGSTPESTKVAARNAMRVVSGVNDRQVQQIAGSKALWVDDRPSNNIYERQALEALGIRFVISTSTEDALKLLASQSFDVIISDMGRPPDSHAGYTLLDRLRSNGNNTPYVIYAGSNSAEHQAMARSKGAVGCTNNPTELFQLVLSALSH
jgi:CheY-like chemotaxis protein